MFFVWSCSLSTLRFTKLTTALPDADLSVMDHQKDLLRQKRILRSKINDYYGDRYWSLPSFLSSYELHLSE